MLRRVFSLGARVFIALVMIGLIHQQMDYETSGAAPGPKFVTPGEDKRAEQDDGLDLQTMVDLAINAARDLLGGAPEQSQSSLDQLRSRSGS